MLQPIPEHHCAFHKGLAKRGSWSSWSLTETVWLLFNFWWFGLKLEKVPSIHVSQRISVPKTLLSICQMKELNQIWSSPSLSHPPAKNYVSWLHSRDVRSVGFGVRLLDFESWLCDLRALWPWRMSLSLGLFICKVEMIVPSRQFIELLGELNEIRHICRNEIRHVKAYM